MQYFNNAFVLHKQYSWTQGTPGNNGRTVPGKPMLLLYLALVKMNIKYLKSFIHFIMFYPGTSSGKARHFFVLRKSLGVLPVYFLKHVLK